MGFAVLVIAALAAARSEGITPLNLNQAAVWEWRCRHDFELEARARFGRLADAFLKHNAPQKISEIAKQAAADEHRHAGVCRDLIHHLGGEVPQDRAVQAGEVAPASLGEKSRLLYEVVAMSCVTETLSCTLLGVLVDRTQDTRIKQAMHSILSDEVRHSRLGWAYLADRSAQGPQSFLADYLPNMLAGTVHEEIFNACAESPFDAELGTFGILNRAERLEIFRSTMTDVVFPGLERFEVDTGRGRQWLDDQIHGGSKS